MNKCFFCQYKLEPSFKDTENLEKFLSPRRKLLSRDRTRSCAKHQRKLSKEIKYARYLAIISYVSYQGLRKK